MRNKLRPRFDYQPCHAALAALDEAAKLAPSLNRQALLDKLVMCGLWALQMEQSRPPALFGTNRGYWRAAGSGTAPRQVDT